VAVVLGQSVAMEHQQLLEMVAQVLLHLFLVHQYLMVVAAVVLDGKLTQVVVELAAEVLVVRQVLQVMAQPIQVAAVVLAITPVELQFLALAVVD
jgi:hypothetical protein